MELATIQELTGAAYDAALDPALWPAVLERGARLFGAGLAIVRIMDAEGRDLVMLGAGACLTRELNAQYRTHWIDKDIHLRSALVKATLWNRAVVSERDVACEEEERTSPYIQEFMRPLELGRVVASISKDHSGWATAAFHRSLAAPFADRKMLDAGAALMPHLIRAARMTASQCTAAVLEAGVSTLFAHVEHAIFLLDDRARIVWMNAAAEAALETGAMRCGRQGNLLVDGAAGAMIDKLAAEASRAVHSGSPPKVAPHQTGEARYIVRGRVIGCETWPRIVFERASILIECLNQAASPSAVDRLREAFGLTRAEAEIALALTEDKGAAEIAEARGVSEETVRSQSQAIFRKVGVSRRAALIRIVAKLSD
jgi:DNA-binding CsgD family transcriptional regulator